MTRQEAAARAWARMREETLGTQHPRLLALQADGPYGLWFARVLFPDGEVVAAYGISAHQAEYRCHAIHQQRAENGNGSPPRFG